MTRVKAHALVSSALLYYACSIGFGLVFDNQLGCMLLIVVPIVVLFVSALYVYTVENLSD